MHRNYLKPQNRIKIPERREDRTYYERIDSALTAYSQRIHSVFSMGKGRRRRVERDTLSGLTIWFLIRAAKNLKKQKNDEEQIRRLAVLNKNKGVVGICSIGDIATHTSDRKLSGNILEDVSKTA